MYIDGVSRFYKNREIEDSLNNRLSSIKSLDERTKFLNNLRSKLDPVSRLIAKKRPDWIDHILVSN